MPKIKLSKPIKAHGEEITEIELREPTGADVMDLGYPYLLIISENAEGEGQAMELRPKVIGRYVSRLGKIPPSSLDEISPADFGEMTGVVLGFFGVEAEKKKG